MDLLNGSAYVLESAQAIDKHGKRYMVALAKATYDFPTDDFTEPRLAKKQLPILSADVFEGEPGLSAAFFECEYGLRKKQCDVILKATAYARNHKPTKELLVGFRVGQCTKKIQIVGNRQWQGLLSLSPSRPEPFTEMPITYSRAFGGSRPPMGKKDEGIFYPQNPIGCGYAKGKYQAALKNTPVPNLEHPNKPVKHCDGDYPPMSFGPIGRSWQPRLAFAGTYDEKWKEETFPLLPADFDETFMQVAPTDQQIPFPVGGEPVVLVNLHPTKDSIVFALPNLDLPMVALTKNRTQHRLEPVVDCITIDADKQQLSILWRAHLPIARSIAEIDTLAAGKVSQCQWRTLVMGLGSCSEQASPDDPADLVDVTDAMENCSDCNLNA